MRRASPSEPIASRFWSKVAAGPTCWEWMAGRDREGYGIFNPRKPSSRAHRIAWHLVNGPLHPALCIMHLCDNPCCVRPDHLALGTTRENTMDAWHKGRLAVGERHPRSLLTDSAVREIRRLCAGGASKSSVAKRFGVSRRLIQRVVAHDMWRHVEAAHV